MPVIISAFASGLLVAKRRGVPVFAPRLEISTPRDLDPRPIGGGALFGIGWGLVGLCPGPALTTLTFGPLLGSVFVLATIAGIALFGLAAHDWPQVTFRGERAGADG